MITSVNRSRRRSVLSYRGPTCITMRIITNYLYLYFLLFTIMLWNETRKRKVFVIENQRETSTFICIFEKHLRLSQTSRSLIRSEGYLNPLSVTNQFMADRLTPYQITLLKEQFDAFDTDGDGKLTMEDTAEIMRKFLGQNPTAAEIAAKHNEIDTNGNGTIEFPEFMEAMAKTILCERVNDEEIMQIFTMLDQDGDGFLNRQEISQGMAGAGIGCSLQEGEELNEQEVDEILEEYDADKDGKLSLEEFAKMIKDEIYGCGMARCFE